MSVAITCAPSRAQPSAAARPMPCAAAVIRIVLSWSLLEAVIRNSMNAAPRRPQNVWLMPKYVPDCRPPAGGLLLVASTEKLAVSLL